MLSKLDSKKASGEGGSGPGRLMNNLQTIGRVLSVEKTLSRLGSNNDRPKSTGKSRPDSKKKPKDGGSPMDSPSKEQKASLWSWKRLKALTVARSRRFKCCFSLFIHSIDGLPTFFDDLYLVVHWKRKDAELMTHPIQVYRGVAEFEEELAYSCSVKGSRTGLNQSVTYGSKNFMLYVSVYNAPELDLGKHRVDLTRLLPISFDELEEENGSGNWTTSFKLSGKAAGAKMNVSFGYVVVGNNNVDSGNMEVPEILNLRESGEKAEKFMRRQGGIRRVESFPNGLMIQNQLEEDVKDLHEILPTSRTELSQSVDLLYQKLDEGRSNALVEKKPIADLICSYIDHQQELDHFMPPEDAGENLCEAPDAEKFYEMEWDFKDFIVEDKGVEVYTKEEVKFMENPARVDQFSRQVPETNISTALENESGMFFREHVRKDIEMAHNFTSKLMNGALESEEYEDKNLNQEDSSDMYSSLRGRTKRRSFSMSDMSSVANGFLDIQDVECNPLSLSPVSEPESPRERLLREFEEDILANGGLLNIDFESDSVEVTCESQVANTHGAISNDQYQSSPCENIKEKTDVKPDVQVKTRTSAARLENLESEALMRDWGLNERAFQRSPPSKFDCVIESSPEDQQQRQLPVLGEGFGPFMQTKNGGFLRSMNPSLFRKAKTGGRLIMQVSRPVVVPAEMGSGVMDILQCLAAMGIEKLSIQANRLMPLEDITGKSVQQMAWEAAPSLEGPQRLGLLHESCRTALNMPMERKGVKGVSLRPTTEFVSLDDLAPLAMDKIQTLSIESLRIQSGMSDEDAPSSIIAQSIGGLSALTDSRNLGGTSGLQLLNIKDNGEDIDGLMSLSLTFDEWRKLDSGEMDDDRASKLLLAHRASKTDIKSKRKKRRGTGRKYGLLGNNLTFALMVQLHDPSRNYEPVGTPMLALIQAERVFFPPKQKIFSSVPPSGNSDEEEEETKSTRNGTFKDDKVVIPQFKITEVHVAGLKTEPGKKKIWGSAKQQTSGSRWLLANGMGKKYKHPLNKLRPVVGSTGNSITTTMTATVQPSGETIWSISKVINALNPHIRNPNVIIPGGALGIC